VVAVAIQLNGEIVVAEERVDLVTCDHTVHLGPGEPVALGERDEGVLERRSGGTTTVVKQAAEPRCARTPGETREHVRKLGES